MELERGEQGRGGAERETDTGHSQIMKNVLSRLKIFWFVLLYF